MEITFKKLSTLFLFKKTQYREVIAWKKITTILNDTFQSYYDLFQVNYIQLRYNENIGSNDILRQSFRSSQWRCSIKQVFLKISQAPELQLFQKRDSDTDLFL